MSGGDQAGAPAAQPCRQDQRGGQADVPPDVGLRRLLGRVQRDRGHVVKQVHGEEDRVFGGGADLPRGHGRPHVDHQHDQEGSEFVQSGEKMGVSIRAIKLLSHFIL